MGHYFFDSLFIYASSLSFSYLDRVEEQALGEVGASLAVVHLLDQMLDLLHDVLEGAFELALRRHFPVQRFHDREQIAVERDPGAGRRGDDAHDLYPEALDGGRLVGVDLDEVLRAGQRQHRFDALLDAGQLQVAAGVVNLAVQVHQAADRRAVHIGDRCQVDENLAATAGDEAR